MSPDLGGTLFCKVTESFRRPPENLPHFPWRRKRKPRQQFLFSSQRNQIRKKTIGSWHARGKLAEEYQTCVDEVSFAILRYQKAALERILARVARCQDGDPLAVPLVRIINAPFLDPAHKIVAGNSVGSIEHRVVRCQKRHGRVLVRDAIIREAQAVGRKLASLETVGPVVLLHDSAACLDEIEQPGQMGGKVVADVEGAHADQDGIQTAQSIDGKIGARQHFHFIAHLFQSSGYAVAGSRQVADPLAARLHVKAHGANVRGRVEQNRRDMVIADLHARISVGPVIDFRLRSDEGCRRLGGSRDIERKGCLVADSGKPEGLNRG
jgi:hypothetical protein